MGVSEMKVPKFYGISSKRLSEESCSYWSLVLCRESTCSSLGQQGCFFFFVVLAMPQMSDAKHPAIWSHPAYISVSLMSCHVKLKTDFNHRKRESIFLTHFSWSTSILGNPLATHQRPFPLTDQRDVIFRSVMRISWIYSSVPRKLDSHSRRCAGCRFEGCLWTKCDQWNQWDSGVWTPYIDAENSSHSFSSSSKLS